MDKNITLTRLFIPIYLTMLLNLATLVINTYMISLVDPRLVGALAAGHQVFILFLNVFNLLGVGCSVVISQALGAKNNKLAIRAIHISISLNFLIGLICGIIVFIFARNILNLMQIPTEISDESYVYLRIISIIFFIDGVAIILATVARVYGFANYALMASLLMNVVIIIGNILSLFEPFGLPYYGLMGVGISTIAGKIIGVAFYFIILIKIMKIPIIFKLFVNAKIYIAKKILKVGLPSAGENLLWSLQYLVAFSFVASMGEDSLAVQTIYFQFSSFIFFAAIALGLSNQVIVARFVGASENEQAYNHTFKTAKIGFISTFLFVGGVFVCQDFLMNLMNLTENMKTLMRPLFYVSFFLEFSRTLNIVMVNALKASGDVKFPFVTGAASMWLISIPLGYLLGITLGYGIIGIWIAFVIDETIRGLINMFRWISRKWIGKKLV
ncbi:MATE family efflux protein [Campylobacter blaseri]|uniref:MATE family efflux transporter n=1 Tax=Campylobacter blaseri TaxID=2042961 RepID=A0A2P8QZT4_9BACT|nr:MATE family efflux transporter [Campylobacter blaseri]PSM51748.1 MATE family efflux transporter [Campylobacter blaseri]PSM53539.1 MATE family efflux transporter [Campylobacter blaseri]QKF86346.1 MATE family efflux protein [Campylobacter blaseri]